MPSSCGAAWCPTSPPTRPRRTIRSNGYVPAGLTLEQADALRRADPAEYVRRARASMADHVRTLLAMKARGTVLFDYGNNLRGEAELGGIPHELAFSYPGFVPEYMRPLVLRRQGAVPLGGALRRGRRHPRHRSRRARGVPRRRPAPSLDSAGPEARQVPGAAGAHLLARAGRARAARTPLQSHGARRSAARPDRHRARPSRRRLGGLALSRDRGDAGRQRRGRRLADPERACSTPPRAPRG